MIISDGGELQPTPALALRPVSGDGVAVTELIWGVAVWLALPWLEAGGIALGRHGFRLTDVRVGDLLDRARDHGALGVLHRLGARLRAAWTQDAQAAAAELPALWRALRIHPDGAIHAAASRASCEQATAELYGYYLVQDCAIFDVVVAPIASGLWGSPVEPAASAEPLSSADALAIQGWLADAGRAAARWLAAPEPPTASAAFYLPDREAVDDAPFPRSAEALAPSFALPLGLHGFHSGWMDDTEVDPRSALGFASRRLVRLRATAAVLHWSAPHWRPPRGPGHALPLLIKHPDGAYVGVTSGAGGALVPCGDRVLKLKRCGYKYLGVQPAATRDRAQVLRDGALHESTYAGAMGLGEVDDLLAEHDAIAVLAELGVVAASRPAALICPPPGALALTPPAGCMITEVVTDVRADEVFVLALTDAAPAEPGEPREVVHDLGRAIGGLYRLLHDARVVRGNGNSWYGNDALCADGAIALCDLEGILPEHRVSGAIHRLFRELDVHMFRAGVLVSCGTIRSGDPERTLAVAGWLLRAFEAGYRGRAAPRAPIAAAYVARQLARVT